MSGKELIPDDRAAAPTAKQQMIIDGLAGRREIDWLESARTLVLRHQTDTAKAVLTAAHAAWPASGDIRLALAGMLQLTGQPAQAESMLRELLVDQPDHVAAAFLLAKMLKDGGRTHATATVIRAVLAQKKYGAADLIQAVELLDDCNRKQDAAAICEDAISAGLSDPRIHMHSAMLLAQLGAFEVARGRYDHVLANSPDALDWGVPLGLAGLQRYRDESHPDFSFFQKCLQRSDLTEKATLSLRFALGKAYDDIGDYAKASDHLRAANAIAHARTRWSRKHWRRSIEARIARKPFAFRLATPDDWAPLFIVGMPRSGTTLLAELLARHPAVCNRGESAWLPALAQRLSAVDARTLPAFERAAADYRAQLRQDDSDAYWFVDKQPHNFLHADLILALFPNARILYCRRNARDNALSLWSQLFVAETQDFSYDFADIAAVAQGCSRLMSHWQARYGDSIRAVSYEDLTSSPASCLAAIAAWLNLSEHDWLGSHARSASISTGSLWQARQPVYHRSVGRWRNYAPYVPELLRLPDH
jgi:tetratricopeptide (TPR) repeat protein